MVLVIDFGNTRNKASVFKEFTRIKDYSFCKNDTLVGLKEIVTNHQNISCSIAASVANVPQEIISFLQDNTTFVNITHATKLPFANKYETPNTLGIDRIVLMAGAALQYPNKNVLVIDCGTCITYDLLTQESEYLGGSISPGIQIRYKSLNTFTDKLPLLEKKEPKSYIGATTNESIHSGVINGVCNEIEGFISQYSLNFSDLTIILTGGDAKFLAKSIKSIIFVRSKFLLESLNQFFNYLNNKND